MPRLSGPPVLNGQNNIDEVQMKFLITPLQQITPDLMQSRNGSCLNRYSDVDNLRHACQAWHVERFSMARWV